MPPGQDMLDVTVNRNPCSDITAPRVPRTVRGTAAVRGGEPYYLVAELDWDDMASAERAFQSPEGQAAGQDVPNFATAAQIGAVITG